MVLDKIYIFVRTLSVIIVFRRAQGHERENKRPNRMSPFSIVNISRKLSGNVVKKSDLPKLVAGRLKQTRLFIPNTRDPSENDMKLIYESAL